jgi:transposase InsO family protein
VSDDALLANIKAIHAQIKGEYGWPRMWKELLALGVRVGKERVRKPMAQHGILGRQKRKHIAITNSNRDLRVAPNLLVRNFNATAPNQVWTSDLRLPSQHPVRLTPLRVRIPPNPCGSASASLSA